MEKLRALAHKFPNILIVVDHTGTPEERTDAYFEDWKRGVEVAASCDNIRWKISGLGMGDNSWTVDSIRRYVLTSIETVGVDRCFFGSNWPVDWLWSTYDELIDAYTAIISGFSRDEQISALLRDCRGDLPDLTAAVVRRGTQRLERHEKHGEDHERGQEAGNCFRRGKLKEVFNSEPFNHDRIPRPSAIWSLWMGAGRRSIAHYAVVEVRELIGGLDWWKRDDYATNRSEAETGNESECGCH